MAKIRAYRLAEELGIDRAEIVERAAAVGVELKNAMAALDEEQVADLRAKLGGIKRKDVSETRVVSGKAGGAIIRRRKRVAPEPVPEPEPVAEPEVVVESPVAPEVAAVAEDAAAAG